MFFTYRSLCAIALSLSGLSLAGVAQAVTEHHYTVRADDSLRRLEVEACFRTKVPNALYAYDERAAYYLTGDMHAVSTAGNQRLQRRGNRVLLRGLKPGTCVSYAVSLDRFSEGGWYQPVHRTNSAIALSPHLFMWYPGPAKDLAPFEVTFDLPTGMQISTPWPRSETRSPRPRFRLGERLPDWDARVALGDLSLEWIELAGTDLQLAVVGELPERVRTALQNWVSEGARAVATVSGRFPVSRLQVLVIPIGRGGEPVPWAEVQRGGGDGVHLFVDERQPIEAFRSDWTLVHELSHLLHPPLTADGRWLYEGIASYYQNVLRARVGVLSPEAAWRQLHAGFERGRLGTAARHSLAEASERMLRDSAFMRVYWSGAAIALLADVELRQRSGGEKSLDTTLAALQRCCLPAPKRWHPRQLMEKLDELSETQVFTRLHARYAYAREFPDLDALYVQLGLDPGADGLHLRDDAPLVETRRAIMARPELRGQSPSRRAPPSLLRKIHKDALAVVCTIPSETGEHVAVHRAASLQAEAAEEG